MKLYPKFHLDTLNVAQGFLTLSLLNQASYHVLIFSKALAE
jgi:hypothetical protein